MNIAIGINIFGECPRQKKCIEVLKKIASKYSNIQLYNITFFNGKNTEENFIHLPFLKQKAKDIIYNSNSEKPIAKEFFDILSKQNCDYFIFLNSDILLSYKVIELILKAEYDTYCVSRHDTYPIKELNQIVPYRIEIAGFDVWAVKKEWWIKNTNKFKNFIYAEHLWDVAFTLEMYNHSRCMLANKDFYVAHEKHDIKWNENSLEAIYNKKLWDSTPYCENWNTFIYSYLVQRKPFGQFLEILPDELEKEKSLLYINK